VLSNLAYDCERAALQRRWHSVWVVSEFLRQSVTEAAPQWTDRLFVVPPILEHACRTAGSGQPSASVDFGLPAGLLRSRTVLFPHRLEEEKGLYDALAVLRTLAERDPRWRMLVPQASPTSGPEGVELVKETQLLAAEFGVADNMVFFPWLTRAAMCGAYAVAGCTLTLSKLPESFGLVPHESILHRRPAVVRPVGALTPAHLDAHGVRYVDSRDAGVVADAVREAVDLDVDAEAVQRLKDKYSVAAMSTALDTALQPFAASFAGNGEAS
jgi:glycosyltransferase involved in cell wall biosynthesis